MKASTTVRGLLVLAAVAVGATGCGSGSSEEDRAAPGSPAAQRTDAEAKPAAVSVLGSTVSADAKHVTVSLKLRQPEGVDPPVARTAVLDLKGVGPWRGDALPSCDPGTVRAENISECAPASVLGSGQATGTADTAKTVAEITVVNGGAGRIVLGSIVHNPAYSKTATVGAVRPQGDGVRITVTFPEDLQVVAGVPIGLQSLDLTLDRHALLGDRRCPSGNGWGYASSVAFQDDTVARKSGAIACSDG